MKYASPLLHGTLIKRYKRFLADITLEDGRVVTAHTANSGSMKGCSTPESPVRLRHVDNPKRKLQYDWEQICENGVWIGVRPVWANDLAEEAIIEGFTPEFQPFERLRREVKYGSRNSRVDLLLEAGEQRIFIEVKSASLAVDGIAYFPDAVSTRATKHLRELMEMVDEGHRAALIFVAQRDDIQSLRPADDIDPTYGKTLRQAQAHGVEILAFACTVGVEGISITRRIPVEL